MTRNMLYKRGRTCWSLNHKGPEIPSCKDKTFFSCDVTYFGATMTQKLTSFHPNDVMFSADYQRNLKGNTLLLQRAPHIFNILHTKWGNWGNVSRCLKTTFLSLWHSVGKRHFCRFGIGATATFLSLWHPKG